MKVSVILTSYNKRHMLTQAIASVLAQTYLDWELFIVDDHSTDGSYQLASAFLLENVFLMQTDLPKHGVSQPYVNRYAHNINLVFPRTKGDYITYLCDDDIYMPTRLQALSEALDRDADKDIVFGVQMVGHQNGGRFKIDNMRNYGDGILYDATNRVDHSSVLHRRKVFEEVGGWDEQAPMRLGDAYFWKRLHAVGHVFYPVMQLTDIHRFNDHSVTWQITLQQELARV